MTKTTMHAYGGVEHTQPGPKAACLLCRIDLLEHVTTCASDLLARWDAQGEAEQTRDDMHELLVVVANLRAALDGVLCDCGGGHWAETCPYQGLAGTPS